MGLRGPKSTVERLCVVNLEQPRPKAPKGLPKHAVSLWDDIVGAYPADHFSAGDLPLLDNFVRCVLILEQTNKALAEEGIFTADGSKPHPAIAIRDLQLKAMATLATKLRLPVSSRIRADSAGTRPGKNTPKPWEMHAD